MNKYIIDANVALLAGTPVKDIPREQLICARKCVNFIKEFMDNPESSLVLDAEGRILKEYRGADTLSRGQNMATVFSKWAHQMPKHAEDFIPLQEIRENEFKIYPNSERLRTFDPPDRKYIALSYNHQEKPPIAEASDSKWWGIQDDLRQHGIEVHFIDEPYIKDKFLKKIGS